MASSSLRRVGGLVGREARASLCYRTIPVTLRWTRHDSLSTPTVAGDQKSKKMSSQLMEALGGQMDAPGKENHEKHTRQSASAAEENNTPREEEDPSNPPNRSSRNTSNPLYRSPRLEDMYPALDDFPRRHIGPDEESIKKMLAALDPPAKDMDDFVDQVIPPDVIDRRPLRMEYKSISPPTPDSPQGMGEVEVLGRAVNAAQMNFHRVKSFQGTGYYGTMVPQVIKRNVLESPAWYTSYTPYQAEISQGRLECLLNFQTMVSDLTALPISNASLLDEGTAAAEAMTLSFNALPTDRAKRPGKTFVVSDSLHPQTIGVLRARAEGFGINIKVLDVSDQSAVEKLGDDLVGVMVQYPDTYGRLSNFGPLVEQVHKQGALVSCATDLLALTILAPPGEWGADVAFGSAQRFGVPMGYGGPHAAFFAVQEKYKRRIPGRLVGVSQDRRGKRALRLALQTREQHIRREKATSNVCTAQALLANMSSLYAVYHGPQGLRDIALRCKTGAMVVKELAQYYGFVVDHETLFDTVVIKGGRAELYSPGSYLYLHHLAKKKNLNLRMFPKGDHRVGITIDEETTYVHIRKIAEILAEASRGVQQSDDPEHPELVVRRIFKKVTAEASGDPSSGLPPHLRRKTEYLKHPVFNTHHSETELLRYIHHLQSKDLSLVHSMIPLGSCTMKLNSSTEMAIISEPGFANMHPHSNRTMGYRALRAMLTQQLADITGMDSVSLQPNSGAQGEYAGLRAIRHHHAQRGESNRDICLIPVSAHGTNPASATMAGMRVVPIKCDTKTGNLDMADLEAKCERHAHELGAIMVTYPSTFGVFEPGIRRVCETVHAHGGQVYMDGANMNAQIGLCSPGEIGADVCHLNLHKTFCIPHGGGGPGVGPICVKSHLKKGLPGISMTGEKGLGELGSDYPIASAPFGSASILPISWAYIALMGAPGLRRATEVTLLNANYLLTRLKPHYPILYTNEHGRCAHEFILDARPFAASAGIEAIDVAKRLQDYGFHAPTMSWPVANTLMIEPTESESQEEMDRFVDALISIRAEIAEIERGDAPRQGNVLKMAPHPMLDIVDGDGNGKWERPYTRDKAAYPLPWLREKKFWPSVARVDDKYGDLNLFCTCPPVEDTTGGNLSSVQED